MINLHLQSNKRHFEQLDIRSICHLFNVLLLTNWKHLNKNLVSELSNTGIKDSLSQIFTYTYRLSFLSFLCWQNLWTKFTIILTMGKNMKNYPSSKQAPEQHPTRTKNKPERSNQCINALREIKKYQETTGLLIRGLPFQRLVRSTAMKYNTEMRFQRAVLPCSWFYKVIRIKDL